MPKKYLTDSAPATIITNDLFLAAFLSSVGCELSRIEKNDRKRVSFVFVGERVRELRQAYSTGPVQVDMRDFRGNLNKLRDLLGNTVTSSLPEERSMPHASERIPRTYQNTTRHTALPSYAHA